jgi:hypothetical protein
LDEMAVRIGGQRMFLWRAVDDEGRFWTCSSRSGATSELPQGSCESC